MSNKNRKNKDNIVYSTNPDFTFDDEEIQETQTLPASKQKLIVRLETKNRSGKKVTVIDGFIGNDEDREKLCKQLKSKCGTGGSVQDDTIEIQGDLRDKIVLLLKNDGFNAKRSG